MTRNLIAAFAVLGLAVSSAGAQTVKIGLIMPYSGQFADAATQMDNAIKLYVKEHGDTVAGRKLEFLVQEVNREINTIGSKAQNAGIASLVVDMKAELERVREQIQNVE